MKRDLTLFPDDNVGNALWQMMNDGDDLNQEREIEFSVIFPSEDAALKFGQMLLENNQKLSFSPYDGNEEFPWEITAYPFVGASYENIRSYQNLLISSAEPLGGQYDGFYCAAA
jgi:hypothetical protein